jgi:hypothetical protein
MAAIPTRKDPERGVSWDENLLRGFPMTAAFMTRDQDKFAMIFRRFDALTARSLLYQQSKIAGLEAQLKKCDEDDSRILADSLVISAASWEDFEKNSTDPTISDVERDLVQERFYLAHKIQKALKEYRMYIVPERIRQELR